MKNKSRVGYKNPPQHSIWKKGQSGNPSGKPKKTPPKKLAKGVLELLIEALEKKIVVKIKGKPTKMTRLRAMCEMLVSSAMAGDKVALKKIIDLATTLPVEEAAEDGVLKFRITSSLLPTLEAMMAAKGKEEDDN